MSKSKVRRVIAAAVALIMGVFAVLAVSCDGFQWGKLALALLLSLSAGIFTAAGIRIPAKGSIFLLFLLPFGALVCMEFFTHVPWDLSPAITLLNYLFFLILYLIFTAAGGGTRWGCMLAPLFPALAGTVNYFVVSFRSSPVVPWDFYSVRTAASVAESYNIEMSWRLYFVLMGFVWLMIIGEKTSIERMQIKKRLVSLGISAVLLAGFVTFVQTESCQVIFGLDTILFTPNVLYRNNGFMVAYLANLQYLHIEKPEGYSVSKVQQTAESVEGWTEENEGSVSMIQEKPNILVIMNEAFSDLSVYGDFSVSEDYMPFWRSLSENTIKGNLYVSVKGGNTANTEFEFLTGNSMSFLPAGSVPYQQFLNGEMPSLASVLGELGYLTAALHPYYSTGWNRDKVYEYLGFDKQYFRDTGGFENASLLRGWVDDESAFQKLIELYEQKDEGTPLFAFEVTMQNHGGYSKEYADLTNEIQIVSLSEEIRNFHKVQTEATEKYLTLIKKSDEAFRELIEYFEKQDEKTLILMFGDHQPSEYVTNTILRALGEDTGTRNDTVEKLARGYEVPFLLWANYDIEEKEVEAISANYLGTLLMETADIPLTGYQSYLKKLSETYPVVTANFCMDAGGNFSQEQTLNEYAVLQYNNLVDRKNRLEEFFE